jgi:hypothetical protein
MNKIEFKQKVINARYEKKRKDKDIERTLDSYTYHLKEKGRERRRGIYV